MSMCFFFTSLPIQATIGVRVIVTMQIFVFMQQIHAWDKVMRPRFHYSIDNVILTLLFDLLFSIVSMHCIALHLVFRFNIVLM